MIGRFNLPSYGVLGQSALVALLFAYPVVALFENRVPIAPIFSAAVLGGFGLYALVRLPPRERYTVVLIGLGVLFWFGVSSLLARDGSDPEKIRQFGLTLLLFGLLTASAMLDRGVIDHLPLGLVLLGSFALSLLILAPGTYQEGRVSFDDNNPIWMARTIGTLGIGALALNLRTRKNLPIYLGMFMLSAIGVVMTGSRGPLTGMIMCAGMMVILTRGASRLNLVLLGLFGSLVLGVALFGLVPLDGVRGLTFSSDDASSAIRLAMYEYTLRTIGQNPAGIGVGWFMFEGLSWPHNIYLELFVEWGWIPASAFVIFTVTGAIGLFRLSGRYDVLKLLFVYDFINSCLSGDISSPRFLYALLIVGNAANLYKIIWSEPAPRANARAADTSTPAIDQGGR